MKENISIRKNIYSSNKYKEVIDTDFSELFSARERFTVEDFFNLYNELFLEIPETGELSHAALVQKSNQLITPGKDAKDNEIENLQSTIEDLQKQLLEANQPTAEVENIKEHPRFGNGTMIRRFTASLRGAELFLMDQGYKRRFEFNDAEMRDSVLRLLEYKKDNGEADMYQVPAFPDRVIDDIPSGPGLTIENFNEPWTPSEFLSESEELRIELDPSDAQLNPKKYDGDYGRYRRELEKDLNEKTNYIEALDDKIEEIAEQIRNLRK